LLRPILGLRKSFLRRPAKPARLRVAVVGAPDRRRSMAAMGESVMRLTYGTYVADPDVLRDEVAAAEAAGFEAVYFSEHHGLPGYIANPLAAATFVLGCSPSLRSGPMPLLLPLHDPVRIAEQAALVDAISGGRLVMGLGAGFMPRDFEQCGVPVDERGDRLAEGVTILKRLWQGDGSAFRGQHHDVPMQDPLYPPPHQPGGPPVWLATGTPAGLRRAAEVADGIAIDSVRSAGDVESLARRFQESRAARGNAPGTIAVMRRAWIGPPPEVDPFVASIKSNLEENAKKAPPGGAPWLDEMGAVTQAAVFDRIFAGTEDEVADQLDAFVDRTHVDEVMVKVQWTSATPREQLLDQLGRWAAVARRTAGRA
jgi:alkanesulfonate monooxygenase SsuD/methylene tetrahydromethanopterin reductase-like flavin-dependent oxidoreductase (luciferase family)